MATVNDIPERGGVGGQEQLELLRAYLKDSDPNDYKFPDDLLIPLLVQDDVVTVWQDITGYGEDAVPWTYNPLDISSPVNRIRVMVGDTVELSLRYTDYDLEKYLSVIPLRYVITSIKAKEAGDSTYPSDPFDPIRIVRDYLEDKDGTKYTDTDIVDNLFNSGLDPYSFVVEVMKSESGKNAVSSSTSSGGDINLATLDGISFTSKTSAEEIEDSEKSQEAILRYGASTLYGKSSDYYGFWLEGENLAKVDWEKEWYAL